MFCKLFKSLYEGSLRGQADAILVFTNLLAHADRDGVVDKHPRAIADEVGISVERIRKALDDLELPDPESRTPDQEGRRIVRLDEHRNWGWSIVNYAKYRAIRSEEDRRDQNREAQQRHRYKSKPPSAAVSRDNPKKAQVEAEAEAEAEGEVEAEKEEAPPHTPPQEGLDSGPAFAEFWKAYPRKDAKQTALKAWDKLSAKDRAAAWAGLSLAKQSEQWRREGGKFIPYAATWLNQQRWTDEGTQPPEEIDVLDRPEFQAFLNRKD